jgi:single-stranded-DNA-specific exonuclease
MADPVWTIRPAHPERDAVAQSLGLHPGAAQVLLNRGGIAGATAQFLSPKLADLHDPAALKDIDRAVEMLTDALIARTPICIYGDYDVDGTTSTAILVESLRALGGAVGYYLPHRLLQGYGLHEEAVDEIVAQGFKLLVTADLGISNAKEVAHAKERGLSVIVIDHHQVPERLPIADAVINPHRPDDTFAFKPMCAAGVAFHVLVALRRRLRQPDLIGKFPDLDLRRVLDLVALATVADMVPLIGINRILVARGLDVLRTGQRPGLAALARVAGLDPLRADAQALGFRLGPRVNAAGRMGSAVRCVELFLADGLVASDLASRLDQENSARKNVEEYVLKRAVTQAESLLRASPQTLGIMVYGDDWHPGVVGIVASRLIEKFKRPALVVGQGGKGSGRSFGGVHLLNVLHACADHFVKYGGHPFAAGVTMKDGGGAALQRAFALATAAEIERGGANLDVALDVDAELEGAHIDGGLVADLDRVGPFGVGNPEPVFSLRNMRVISRRQVGDGHLKLELALSDTQKISAIGFKMASHDAAFSDVLDVAFTPFISHFSGSPTVELRLRALRIS